MKIRFLCKFAEPFNRRLMRNVRYVRGDVADHDDFEPAVLQHLFSTGPRDQSEALGKLVQEHGEEWQRRDKDGKQDWREPAWFRSRMIPGVEFYNPPKKKPTLHTHLPPRDAHGRFEKE